MAEDLPPLPEGGPFDLLGVDEDDPNLDARELKRAYVRKIKIYKPDLAPDAFRRLREAFEAARQTLEYRAAFDSDHFDSDEGPGAAGEDLRSSEDPSEEDQTPLAEEPSKSEVAIREAWGLAEKGEFDQAEARLRASLAEHPRAEGTREALFLLAEARGVETQAAAEILVEGLRSGLPLSSWLVGVLSEAELVQLASNSAFAWETLEAAEDPLAILLWRSRLTSLLLVGEHEAVAREVLASDAPSSPSESFDQALRLCVAAALALDAPDASRELYSRHAAVEGSEEPYSLEGRVLELQHMARVWREAGAHESPAGARLFRLVLLEPLLDDAHFQAQIFVLQQDVIRSPLDYLEVIDRVVGLDSGALLPIFSALDSLQPEDDPYLLPGHARRDLERDYLDLEKALAGDVLNQANGWTLGAAGLMQCVGIWKVGWLGLTWLPVFAVALFLFVRIDSFVYRRSLRPRMAALYRAQRVSHVLVVAHLRETKNHDSVDSFIENLDEDLGLNALSWLLSARLMDSD